MSANASFTVILGGDGTAATPTDPSAAKPGRPANWTGFPNNYCFTREAERVLREVHHDRTEVVSGDIVLRAAGHRVARGTVQFAYLMSQLPPVIGRLRKKLLAEGMEFEAGYATRIHCQLGASPQERTYRRKGTRRQGS